MRIKTGKVNDIEKLIKQKIKVMDHDFHSEVAKNATGAAARPPPRSFGKRGENPFFKKHRGRGSKRAENRGSFSKRHRSRR